MAKTPAVSIYPLLWYLEDYLKKNKPEKSRAGQYALALRCVEALLRVMASNRAMCRECPGGWPRCMAEVEKVLARLDPTRRK